RKCNQSAHVSAQTQLACAGIQPERLRFCTNATSLCRNSIKTPASMHKRNLLVHKLNQDARIHAQTQLACAQTQSGHQHACTNTTCLCKTTIRTPESMHKRNLLVHKFNQDTHIHAQTQHASSCFPKPMQASVKLDVIHFFNVQFLYG